jgi:hypothetical protein
VLFPLLPLGLEDLALLVLAVPFGKDLGRQCGLVLDGGREVLLGSAASDAVTEGVGRVVGRSGF